MGNNVSKKLTAYARHADLYAFLVKYHNSDFTNEGDSIRLKSNHSISIKTCRWDVQESFCLSEKSWHIF